MFWVRIFSARHSFFLIRFFIECQTHLGSTSTGGKDIVVLLQNSLLDRHFKVTTRAENSYRVLKLFLHVSKEKQKERFLERIDTPAKNWKFSADDIRERALYGRYTDTLDEVINATATAHSPWYALPADQKWYTRYLVSEAVVRALRACCHEYPQPSDDLRGRLAECRRLLEEE